MPLPLKSPSAGHASKVAAALPHSEWKGAGDHCLVSNGWDSQASILIPKTSLVTHCNIKQQHWQNANPNLANPSPASHLATLNCRSAPPKYCPSVCHQWRNNYFWMYHFHVFLVFPPCKLQWCWTGYMHHLGNRCARTPLSAAVPGEKDSQVHCQRKEPPWLQGGELGGDTKSNLQVRGGPSRGWVSAIKTSPCVYTSSWL